MQRTVSPKFKEDVKIKCFLWCDRHCCLCKKNCGPDIELAHIDQKINGEKINDIDNAVPLCYDCHAKVGHYNTEHPRGNKYKPKELKARREQVYEGFTRHLVPIIDFRITQILLNEQLRKFPDVGFQISHMERSLPVHVLTSVDIFQKGKKVYNPGGHYAKRQSWKMNPGFKTQGHFQIPDRIVNNQNRISAILNAEVVDEYGRHHLLLPMEWVYEASSKNWWYNP
ncbi:MAG: hypothetical protein WD898_04090 [Candidatus Paceibacterota bacterium]